MKSKLSRKIEQKGASLVIVFLGVIILASLFFVGGIIPGKSDLHENEPSFTVLPEVPLDKKNTLQLKTIKFKSCVADASVSFLVDSSGSMAFGTKLSNLKTALKIFADNYPLEGLISLQTFSTYSSNPSIDVPFDYFKNNKSRFINSINSIYPDGGTYTKNAFEVAKAKFAQAKIKFPGSKFTLIFISDGIPETSATNNLCPGGKGPDSKYCTSSPNKPSACRCFATEQDPTSVANEIKSQDVRIFSIGYINEEDDKFKDDLTELMTNVASSPDDFYIAPITNQLTSILQRISTKICNY